MLAYAKINLTLEILNRREDGFHMLRSVMLPIGLADELKFTPAERFSFTCEPPQLTHDNLVVRAFELIGLADAPLHVELRKNVPVGAGLGGGSSDAAAVLRAAMNGALGALPARDWIADARALGSDIPFFLAEGGALVEGTGERVTALGALPPWSVVLVVPHVHVASAQAYGRLAQTREGTSVPSRPRADSSSLRALSAVQRGDYAAAIAAATNDFEPIVTRDYPEVARTLEALRRAGAAHAMLSGSGGACFALCRNDCEARALAVRLAPTPEASVHVVPLAPDAAWRAPAPV
ncbi:MAG: 4-(cytidine 5'-diphospho)-2-C-methyl-D-erythritol kinase [Candidatus Velthaea sp.]